MLDLGIVRPGSTLRIPFSTFDKDDGSSITCTSFAVADILIYKDGSTTERASTSGFTATTDFDSKTGKHLIAIDLADNTTADFFAAGSEYLVAIDAVTVDAVTVGAWVARFRIGYRSSVLDTTLATLASQTSFTLTSGPAEDDALNGMWAVVHDAASAVQISWVQISDYTGSSKTVTLAAGATFTVAAKDNISVFFPGNVTHFAAVAGTFASGRPEVNTTHAAGTAWNSAAIGPNTLAADTITAASVAASAVTEIQTGLATAAALDAVDNFLDTEIAAIIATLGTPAGASMSADIAAIESQTDDIGAAGAGLTAVPWNSAWDAEVQSEVDDALVAQNLDHLIKIAVDTDFGTTVHLNSVIGYLADAGGTATFDRTTDALEVLGAATAPSAASIADAIWDEILAGHLGAGSTGEALNAAGAGGDPWVTALPGAYGAGSAGFIVGTNINATVSSRASQTSVDTLDNFVDTEISAIKAKTDGLTFSGDNVLAKLADVAHGGSATSLQIATVNIDANSQFLTSYSIGNSGGGPAISLGHVAGTTIAIDITGNITGNLSGSIGSYTGNTPQTGDAFAVVNSGTHGNAALKTLIDTLDNFVDTEIAAILEDTGTTLPSQIAALAFSTHSAADVWGFATRVLTAGTNIALAKGVGVTGFNDLSAAQVNAEVLDVLNVDTLIDGKTFVQSQIYVSAVVLGRVSGAGTGTEVFRGLDEATTRVTVTVDASGNRTDVTYG